MPLKTVLVVIIWPLLYVVQLGTVIVATAIAGKAFEFTGASTPPAIIQSGLAASQSLWHILLTSLVSCPHQVSGYGFQESSFS